MTHWRRHEDEIEADDGEERITATACGRLATYQETNSDPSLATCLECQEIVIVLNDLALRRNPHVKPGI